MYDFGIIGSGPAGYTAALQAGAAGKKVVLFEKDFIGGVCLNRGCIPTKTIMHAAAAGVAGVGLRQQDEQGNTILHAAETGMSFEQAMSHADEVIAKLRKGLETSFKNAKVEVVNAEAAVRGANTIEADGKLYQCKQIIAATGAKARELPNLPFDHKKVLNSDDILKLKKLPKNVTIVGSGAIGIEWTRIFTAFGVDVTLIEAADRLLPLADVEVSKRVERLFKEAGIKFVTSHTGQIPDAEIILVAIGRVANAAPSGVTCLGDACGEIQLAHFASKQALEFISGIPFDKTLVPSVVYGMPEIAWVGKREQDLEPGTFQKVSLPLGALSKAHCDGHTNGLIKLLAREGKLIGAHVVAPEASALIQQMVIAMQFGIGVEQLKEVCFAHPTYSEGIFECLMRF